MARVVDLTGENVTRKSRKERSYGTKTDLPSTTVERGSTHWTNGSNVAVDGVLEVAGTSYFSGVTTISGALTIAGSTGITGPLTIQGVTDITGELNVTGPTNLDGVTTIGGDTTITGLLAVDGPTTISGTLDIEGVTTVAADFEIISGGLFKSGVTTIEPTGKATFGTFIIDPSSNKLIQAPGGWLFSDGSDSIGLAGSSTSSVNLNSARAELVYGLSSRVVARPSAIDLTAPAVHMTGTLFMAGGVTEIRKDRLRISELPTITGQTANVYCNPSGVFYRIIT